MIISTTPSQEKAVELVILTAFYGVVSYAVGVTMGQELSAKRLFLHYSPFSRPKVVCGNLYYFAVFCPIYKQTSANIK